MELNDFDVIFESDSVLCVQTELYGDFEIEFLYENAVYLLDLEIHEYTTIPYEGNYFCRDFRDNLLSFTFLKGC